MSGQYRKKNRPEGDAFYTNPEIALRCINEVEKVLGWKKCDLVIEPSAGNGSFLKQIPFEPAIGMDILPKDKEIEERDFFTFTPSKKYKSIYVIGNPPFGRRNNLSIAFFNHAAKWAQAICFLIPRSFRKYTLQNRLDQNFHLEHDIDLPLGDYVFIPPVWVRCCFQIWVRKDEPRPIVKLPKTHSHWTIVNPSTLKTKADFETIDFALRYCGCRLGEIVEEDLDQLKIGLWYFIQANIHPELLKKRFAALDYSIGLNTVSYHCINQGELVQLYEQAYGHKGRK